jgi:hypothetical protein
MSLLIRGIPVKPGGLAVLLAMIPGQWPKEAVLNKYMLKAWRAARKGLLFLYIDFSY